MAGPARTITPLPARFGRTQAKSYREMLQDRTDGEETRLRGLVGKLFDGKLNVCGSVALANDGVATTTDIDDPRIGPNTVAFLEALDAGAAAERGGTTLFQTFNAAGKIRLTHSASVTTRTFGYALLG